MPGLKGGALTEFDIRTRLTEVLQLRGLQKQALGAKLDETMSKLSRLELAQLAANPTWQGLKQVVGTRITYISKPKKDHSGPMDASIAGERISCPVNQTIGSPGPSGLPYTRSLAK